MKQCIRGRNTFLFPVGSCDLHPSGLLQCCNRLREFSGNENRFVESQVAAAAFLSGHQQGATFPVHHEHGAAENSVSSHQLSSGHDGSRRTGDRGRLMLGDKARQLSAPPPCAAGSEAMISPLPCGRISCKSPPLLSCQGEVRREELKLKDCEPHGHCRDCAFAQRGNDGEKKRLSTRFLLLCRTGEAVQVEGS